MERDGGSHAVLRGSTGQGIAMRGICATERICLSIIAQTVQFGGLLYCVDQDFEVAIACSGFVEVKTRVLHTSS